MDREPGRNTILGALAGLARAENRGDVIDEVFIICDALGIERPEWDEEDGGYAFAWEREEA